jgi:hypothetical protein
MSSKPTLGIRMFERLPVLSTVFLKGRQHLAWAHPCHHRVIFLLGGFSGHFGALGTALITAASV